MYFLILQGKENQRINYFSGCLKCKKCEEGLLNEMENEILHICSGKKKQIVFFHTSKFTPLRMKSFFLR